jgi:hypothetical protein
VEASEMNQPSGEDMEKRYRRNEQANERRSTNRTHSQRNPTDWILSLAGVELEAWTIWIFYLYYSRVF